jgi:hypothetical protein
LVQKPIFTCSRNFLWSGPIRLSKSPEEV